MKQNEKQYDKIHTRMMKEGNLFGDETNADIPCEEEHVCRDFDELFYRLARSDFRRRFCLKHADIEYIENKGLQTIRRHAEDFIARRLAPASIPNDGRQTPMRGHPVFIAQHATGCCCRGCLAKWHGITSGHRLTADEQRYVVNVIMDWIKRQMAEKKLQSEKDME